MNSNMKLFDLENLNLRYVPKFEFRISRHWLHRYIEVKSRVQTLG
jgi:hypothetical protein